MQCECVCLLWICLTHWKNINTLQGLEKPLFLNRNGSPVFKLLWTWFVYDFTGIWWGKCHKVSVQIKSHLSKCVVMTASCPALGTTEVRWRFLVCSSYSTPWSSGMGPAPIGRRGGGIAFHRRCLVSVLVIKYTNRSSPLHGIWTNYDQSCLKQH